MATYVVGDIHGRRDLLEELLRCFRPTAADHVVFLGDYIDRGPDSRGVIDLLREYRACSDATVVFLCGNHEYAMLQTLDDHTRHTWIVGMQGLATIRSYSATVAAKIEEAMHRAGPAMFTEKRQLPYQAFMSAMPPEHHEFFGELKYFKRTREAVCVHAGVSDTYTAVEAEDETTLVWGTRPMWWEDYRGPDLIAYGHWGNALPVAEGAVPFTHGRTIGVDAAQSGCLLAVRLPDRAVWSAGEP